MKEPKILRDYQRFNDSKLETFAGSVLSRMSGNVNFVTPMPAMEELDAARQQYAQSLNEALSRDRLKVEQKKELRTNLEGVLTRLSNYVMLIANGNRPIMVSAGFTVSAETKSKRILGKIENLTAELGKNSGEVMVSVTPVKHARSYVFYCGLAGTDRSTWLHFPGTDPFFLFTGLEPLKTWQFAVKAISTKNQAADADPINKVVV